MHTNLEHFSEKKKKKKKKILSPFYNYRLNRQFYYINQFSWHAFCGFNSRKGLHCEDE